MKVDMDKVDRLIERSGKAKSSLIPVLQSAQYEFNWLPPEVLRHVAEKLEIPLIDVYGVATFYRSFSLKPCRVMSVASPAYSGSGSVSSGVPPQPVSAAESRMPVMIPVSVIISRLLIFNLFFVSSPFSYYTLSGCRPLMFTKCL